MSGSGTRLPRAALFLWTALSLGSAACNESAPTVQYVAPAHPRATLVMEPPQLRIGQVATLELVVVTPPEHSVRPVAAPTDVPGLWILAAEAQPVSKESTRWIHRTALRVRARSLGAFTFPAMSVEVEAPDGGVAALAVDALPIEVVSILPEIPDRITPYGPRRFPPTQMRTPIWGSAAAGAIGALAIVGLVALARRQRRLGSETVGAAPGPPVTASWVLGKQDIQSARDRSTSHPFEAAAAASLAMRRYMTRRYPCSVTGLTTQELVETTPPFAATSRWPVFVNLLERLDRFRFLPPDDPGVRERLTESMCALLDACDAFIENSTPPEDRS